MNKHKHCLQVSIQTNKTILIINYLFTILDIVPICVVNIVFSKKKIFFSFPNLTNSLIWDELKAPTLMRPDPVSRFFHYTPLSVSKLSSAPQDYTVYLSDGLHLSERGNQFVAQHLWGLLESRVAHLPFILPYWGDVDPKCPESNLLCDQ